MTALLATKALSSTALDNRGKAAKIAKRLTMEAAGQLTVWCPTTGLTMATGLPATFSFTLTTLHPLAFNATRILLEQPTYIRQLSNAELAGFILSLLAEAKKISISPKSNAYLVRAKLESVASRNQLLDIIEWIVNSLLTSIICYPPLAAHHGDLTLASIQEWMEWTYSIETYSFGGSAPKAVKPPKHLAIESLDVRLKRLNRRFNASLKELIAAYFNYGGEPTIPQAIITNLSPLLKDRVSEASSKLDNLLAAIAKEACDEIVEAATDLIDLRAAAAKAANEGNKLLDSVLDSILEEPSPAPTAPSPTAPLEEATPEAAQTVEVEATPAAIEEAEPNRTEPSIEPSIEPSKATKPLSLAERLAAIKAKEAI